MGSRHHLTIITRHYTVTTPSSFIGNENKIANASTCMQTLSALMWYTQRPNLISTIVQTVLSFQSITRYR